jgi:hypothetical protein
MMMIKYFIPANAGLLVWAGLIGFGLTALPVAFDADKTTLSTSAAYAKGAGNSGGKGGGNGGGNGGGHGKSGSTPGQSTASVNSANGVSGLGGPGSSTSAHSKGQGLTASSLGSLNAAHASAMGLAHANRLNSVVGQIATYKDALTSEDGADIEAAAEALANAANKPIDQSVVGAVNDLLGIDVDQGTEQDIADKAADIQSGETGTEGTD